MLHQVLVAEAGGVPSQWRLRLQERQAGGSGERHPEARAGQHAGHLPHHHRRLHGQPREQHHRHQVLQVRIRSNLLCNVYSLNQETCNRIYELRQATRTLKFIISVLKLVQG